MGFERWNQDTAIGFPTQDTPDFMKELGNNSYYYWPMSGVQDYPSMVWLVFSSGSMSSGGVRGYDGAVRPVITLKKSALES